MRNQKEKIRNKQINRENNKKRNKKKRYINVYDKYLTLLQYIST